MFEAACCGKELLLIPYGQKAHFSDVSALSDENDPKTQTPHSH
jgi:hypothetical protein